MVRAQCVGSNRPSASSKVVVTPLINPPILLAQVAPSHEDMGSCRLTAHLLDASTGEPVIEAQQVSQACC
jgi:hypothetical protein